MHFVAFKGVRIGPCQARTPWSEGVSRSKRLAAVRLDCSSGCSNFRRDSPADRQGRPAGQCRGRGENAIEPRFECGKGDLLRPSVGVAVQVGLAQTNRLEYRRVGEVEHAQVLNPCSASAPSDLEGSMPEPNRQPCRRGHPMTPRQLPR